MKDRSTINLLIAIVILGSFLGIQQWWRAKVPSKEFRRIQLFDLHVDTLTSLEFQYTNVVVKCVKENGVWMTGGEENGMGRADVALLHRVVAGLYSLGKGTTITQKQLKKRGADDTTFGFSPPSLIITATDNRGKHRWVVGKDGALGNMLYIKEDQSDDIFTISADLRKYIPREVDHLRDRVVFSGDSAGSRRLEIRGPNGFVQIIKDTKGEWQIQQPIVANADSTEVEAFLGKLQALRIQEFIADKVDDFSVYGLQGETKQISLDGADGASRMVVLGDVLPDRPDLVYARRADATSVFALRKTVLDLLSSDLEHFRDRRVLLLPIKAIDLISITHGSEQLSLFATMKTGWRITKPVSWLADRRAVGQLLKRWEASVIFEFNDAGSEEKPEWVYRFGSSSLGQTNTIYVLPNHGRKDGIRIKRNDDPAVYQLNIPRLDETETDPLRFKSKRVWSLDVNAIKKVVLESEKGESYALERQEDGLFISTGTNVNLQVNASVLTNMLVNLKFLNASSYVTYDPRNLSDYGLDQPSMTFHVGLNTTNQLGRVLMVGHKTDQGYYAMVKGRDVVFLLRKETVGALSKNIFTDQKVVPVEEK